MPSADLKEKILAELKAAHEHGRALAIHSNRNEPGQYEVAFVDEVREYQVTLRCLTPRGEVDGVSVVRLDDIFRVDSETTYCRRVELLYQYRDSVFSDEATISAGEVTDILRHAAETNAIVHVLDYSDYGPLGFVEEVGEDYVIVRRVSTGGEPDGRATVGLDAIASVHVNRRSDQVVAFLHRYNVDLRKLLES